LRIRVKEALETRPDVVDLGFVANRAVKVFHAQSNATLNKAKGLYLAPLFVTVENGVSVRMRDMTELHLTAWDALDTTIKERFIATMDRKASYRQQWRRDFNLHPELSFLGDIQREIYHYVEKPWAFSPDDAADDEE
jgi:hypothetical protein